MKKRAQKRDKRERKRKRSKLSLLLKLLITVAVLAGLYFFASSSYFNVTSFEVSGNSYYTEEEILIMGGCQTGGNIFWGSDVGQIRERLERDAYMEKVKIRRALPNTIKIELTERKQVAAVVYDDNYAVIDEDGLVLRKSSVAPHLPLIQGLTISRLEVGQKLEVEESVRLRQVMEIVKVMEDYDMYFIRIAMSESDVKAYVFENLVCQGSPKDLIEAMEKNELQKVIRKLLDDKIERGTLMVSGDSYISFSPEIA